MKNIFKKINEFSLNVKSRFGKKFHLVVACLLAIVVVIIFLSSFNKTTNKVSGEVIENKNLSATDFITNTEERLEKILSSIKGAGNVKVFVMANESTRFIYAADKNIKESGTGEHKAQTTSSSIVLSKDGTKTEPIIEVEIYPEITGVLVVAEGANDEKRRLMILNAVSVALDLENTKIEVLAGEKDK